MSHLPGSPKHTPHPADHMADHAQVNRLVRAMRAARIAGHDGRADVLAGKVIQQVDEHIAALREASR